MNGDAINSDAINDSGLPPERRRFLADAAYGAARAVEIRPAETEAARRHLVDSGHPDVALDAAAAAAAAAAVAAPTNKQLSYWATVVHLLIGGMSPTLLNLPATFHQVGYAVGVVGSFVVVAFYAHCVHVLVACERILCRRLRRPSLAYWEVLQQALATGPPRTRWMAGLAKPLTYALFVGIWGGGNATYVLLIGANVQAVLAYACDWPVADRVLIGWLTVPLVLLCWIPDLRAMVVCSVLSNALNAASIVVILYVVLRDFTDAAADAAEGRTAVGSVARLPYFLSVVFVTVNGTGLVLSLKSQMRRPRRFGGVFGVVNAAYVPTAALYALFGLLCYLRFGARTHETVILNLPASSLSCVVQAMYAVAVALFYPLVTYVTFEILWEETPKARLSASPRTLLLLRYAVKTANALFSIGLAFVLPNIALFVSLIGSVCVALDSIILPAIMECLVHSQQPSWRMRLKTTVMIGLGVALMGAGFKDAYVELLRYYST